MSKTEEGFLEMKQTGLIDQILEALGLDSELAKNKYTPAEGTPLTRDVDGEGLQGSYSYASVVGMMLYLAGHSRPDIAYAVNCCARYMFNPRLSHENALKRIGRYLKATSDKGLILNPSVRVRFDTAGSRSGDKHRGAHGWLDSWVYQVERLERGLLQTLSPSIVHLLWRHLCRKLHLGQEHGGGIRSRNHGRDRSRASRD